jgi:hypothetical protein
VNFPFVVGNGDFEETTETAIFEDEMYPVVHYRASNESIAISRHGRYISDQCTARTYDQTKDLALFKIVVLCYCPHLAKSLLRYGLISR